MKPAKEKYYRALFTLAAFYDILLGLTFAFLPVQAFNVLGIAYALISRGDLRRNADLILIGALFKLAYAAAAFYYWATGGLPHVVFAAFGVADAIFFILMAECWLCLMREAKR